MASTTIPFMTGEWPEPSTATVPALQGEVYSSMMDDTYEKNAGSANFVGGTTAATATTSTTTQPVTIAAPPSNLQCKPQCQHTDGAIQVADYILNEIKTNVRGQTAETIRYLIDEDTLKRRRAEWDKLPFMQSWLPPQSDLLAAMAVWYQTVKRVLPES